MSAHSQESITGLYLILVCTEKHRGKCGLSNTSAIIPRSGGREVSQFQDHDASKVGFIQGLFSWLVCPPSSVPIWSLRAIHSIRPEPHPCASFNLTLIGSCLQMPLHRGVGSLEGGDLQILWRTLFTGSVASSYNTV